MLIDKRYLGDGVYASYDGYHIVLTAEDGVVATNTIYLEPSVLAALIAYSKRGVSDDGEPAHGLGASSGDLTP